MIDSILLGDCMSILSHVSDNSNSSTRKDIQMRSCLASEFEVVPYAKQVRYTTSLLTVEVVIETLRVFMPRNPDECDKDHEGQLVFYTGIYKWGDGSYHSCPENEE
jgi:hypothetical protein